MGFIKPRCWAYSRPDSADQANLRSFHAARAGARFGGTIRRLISRGSIARLAVCLLLFASLQASLSASSAAGGHRFLEVTAALDTTNAAHDHATTVCHSCPGHLCLEQHGTLDQASGSPALLDVADTITIEPWPAAEAWAHPPTAPPRAAFIHFISLPRAPPELS